MSHWLTDRTSEDRRKNDRRASTRALLQHEQSLEPFSAGYCENCRGIRDVQVRPMIQRDLTGRYLGGDVLCSVCGWVVATLYRSMNEQGQRQDQGEDQNE